MPLVFHISKNRAQRKTRRKKLKNSLCKTHTFMHKYLNNASISEWYIQKRTNLRYCIDKRNTPIFQQNIKSFCKTNCVFVSFSRKNQAEKQRKTAFFEGEKRSFNLIFFQNRYAILLSSRPAQPSMESMHASTFRRLKAVSK